MKHSLPIVIAFLSGCIAPDEPDWVNDELALFAPGESRDSEHSWVVRSRQVDMLVDALSGELDPDQPSSPATLHIAPFDDVDLIAHLLRVDNGAGPAWVGSVEGDPTGEVVLSQHDGVYVGTFRTQGQLFRLMTTSDGEQIVEEIDESDMPGCHDPLPTYAQPDETGDATQGGTALADGEPALDLLVVYTGAALSAVGGTSAMNALISTAVAETNTGYLNSGVAHRVNLVHSEEVTYSESSFNWTTALSRLQGTSDGFMDNVHTLRDTYGADQVAMIVSNGTYCGLGYFMGTPDASFEANAFTLVSHSCATGYYSFAHELGHNLGSNHDHNNASDGAYAYSYGYQDPGRAFRTVMAYDCPSGGCTRVNQWSNPAVDYQGTTAGVSGTGANAANNVASMAMTDDIALAWRSSQVSQFAATLSSPTPSSTLSGASVTFSWTDASASDYALFVGASPGDQSYAAVRGLGSSTSTLVSGIPVDGRAIHVRLWTEQAGEWQYLDYAYTADSPVAWTPTVLSSPANGSVLSGTSATFTWPSDSASQYVLYTGKFAGDRSLGDYPTTGTSQVATGLPDNGETVYVRLWSLSPDGDWGWTDRTYSAPSSSVAAATTSSITSPTPLSTLSSDTATFSWSDEGADEYNLYVGYAEGHREIFGASTGTGRSQLIGGLPEDSGTVYVRLWTRHGTTWTYTDTTFAAAGAGPPPADAVITSPAAGSLLSGDSATFNWTNAGADEYNLYVGYAQGHREIYTGSQGASTSYLVTGLPQDGADVWVRLWTRHGSDWSYLDTQYTSGP